MAALILMNCCWVPTTKVISSHSQAISSIRKEQTIEAHTKFTRPNYPHKHTPMYWNHNSVSTAWEKKPSTFWPSYYSLRTEFPTYIWSHCWRKKNDALQTCRKKLISQTKTCFYFQFSPFSLPPTEIQCERFEYLAVLKYMSLEKNQLRELQFFHFLGLLLHNVLD